MKALPALVLALCAALPVRAADAPATPASAASGAAACKPDPLPGQTLYLRGGMNNWAALDEAAFQWRCDAYYLNVALSGRHDFKIADDAWTPATTFGEGGGNFVRSFGGAHTVRLVLDGPRATLEIGPQTFVPMPPVQLTDPIALSLRFDSRHAADKQPFGAVVAGTTVRYAVSALPGVEALTLVVEKRRLEGNQELLEYAELARVPMTRRRLGGQDRWTASHRYTDVAVHGHWFEARIGGRTVVLQNNRDTLHWTREKGTGGLGVVSEKPARTAAIRRWRQTVYAADFRVPDWAADVVYYQVFPDRYRNGDPGNDPRPGGGRPQDRYHDRDVEFHARWLDQPWKPGSGDGSDAVYNNDFFGGDLAGLIEKLDEIKSLGANTLYLTPIFQAASNHKYDTADYRRVDPAFGTNADFERLTREAARRGMRVLPDTSLNHTGTDSVYFNRYGNHGTQGAFQGGRINPASPYASWYRFDPSKALPEQQYTGWVGVADLPELNKADAGLRSFFFGAPGGVAQQWLDLGAAGWRMDVAPWVPDDFWRAWRKAVKLHRPDAITVAETWFDASKYFLGDMFDATMNYIFRNAVLDYAAGGHAAAFAAQLEHLREAYPPPAFHAQMNLLSSHDQPRALHVLGWHAGEQDPAVVDRAKQRFRLATFFQLSYPGAPSLYYGDEVGMTGGEDPYNRGPYPWPDLGGQPDLALRADVQRWAALRHRLPVLRRGTLLAPLHADAHVLVLARRLGATWAVTATNNAATPQTVSVVLPPGLKARALSDALGGAPVAVKAGRVQLDLPALSGRVLVSP